MRRYWLVTIIAFIIISCELSACGPSREEQAQAANKQPVECNVRVIFSNGHTDTIHVIYKGELQIDRDGNLVDKWGCCSDYKTIAKGVSYFGILNTE